MITIATGALFLLGQLGRLGFWNQTIVVYAYELGLGIGVVLLSMQRRYRTQLRRPTLVLIGVLCCSLLLSLGQYVVGQQVIATLYLVRLSLYLIAIDIVPRYLKDRWLTLPHRYSHIICLALIIPAIAQYLFFPDLRSLFYQGWDPHAYRVFGQFFEPAIAAAIYGSMIILLLMAKSTPRWQRWAIGYSTILMGLSILTFSRGFYLAMFGTMIWIAAKKRSVRRWVLSAVLLIGVLVAVSPKPFGEGVNLFRTSTITSRVLDYQEAAHVIRSNPILGIGYNHLRSIRPANPVPTRAVSHSGASFHSSFLIILATSGIIGLATFVWYLYSLASRSETVQYLVIFLSIFSLFDNVLLHPFLQMMILCATGVDLISRRKS